MQELLGVTVGHLKTQIAAAGAVICQEVEPYLSPVCLTASAAGDLLFPPSPENNSSNAEFPCSLCWWLLLL